MKIDCPQCSASYNIDTSKFKGKKVFATCKKCGSRFPLFEQKEEEKKEEIADDSTQMIIPCPKCSHVNISAKSCVKCGYIFSSEEKNEDTIIINMDE